jgi:hypothetical protein
MQTLKAWRIRNIVSRAIVHKNIYTQSEAFHPRLIFLIANRWLASSWKIMAYRHSFPFYINQCGSWPQWFAAHTGFTGIYSVNILRHSSLSPVSWILFKFSRTSHCNRFWDQIHTILNIWGIGLRKHTKYINSESFSCNLMQINAIYACVKHVKLYFKLRWTYVAVYSVRQAISVQKLLRHTGQNSLLYLRLHFAHPSAMSCVSRTNTT